MRLMYKSFQILTKWDTVTAKPEQLNQKWHLSFNSASPKGVKRVRQCENQFILFARLKQLTIWPQCFQLDKQSISCANTGHFEHASRRKHSDAKQLHFNFLFYCMNKSWFALESKNPIGCPAWIRPIGKKKLMKMSLSDGMEINAKRKKKDPCSTTYLCGLRECFSIQGYHIQNAQPSCWARERLEQKTDHLKWNSPAKPDIGLLIASLPLYLA